MERESGRGSIASALLSLCALLLSACGSSSPTSPSVEHVSGVWMGHITLRSVSGGECVGATLQLSAGSRDIFAAHIQQTDSTLTATVGYQGNQTSCSFAGSVNGDTVSLSMASCQADRVRSFRCANGEVRDLQLATDAMSGHASSGYGTGTDTSTWRVTAPGSSTPVTLIQRTCLTIPDPPTSVGGMDCGRCHRRTSTPPSTPTPPPTTDLSPLMRPNP